MTKSRQPKGIPTGGEFAANEHDEAPSGLDINEDHLDAYDLNIGDTIDLTRNVLDSGEDADLTITGRQIIRNVTGTLRPETFEVEDSTGTRRSWTISEGDTFDRVPPRDENFEVVDAENITEGDLIDMTRTIDEYIANPFRGGGDSIDNVRDLAALRGKVFRVESAEREEDENGGFDAHELTLVSEEEPAETLNWTAFEGLSDFDVIDPSATDSYPMRRTY